MRALFYVSLAQSAARIGINYGPPMNASDKKRNAAKAALEFIQPGSVLGVGVNGVAIASRIDEFRHVAPGGHS